MPRTRQPPTKRRSSTAVIDAALRLAAREGFQHVTIRALGRELGIPPMSLYGYFASKSALYDGMRERAFEQAFTANTKGGWRAQLDALARNIVEQLRAHPQWLPLLTNRSATPTFPTLTFFESLFEQMIRAGFATDQTLNASAAVISFACGIVLAEGAHMVGAGTAPATSRATSRVARVKDQSSKTPRFSRVATVMRHVDTWSYDEVFELGLRALLDGIESLLGAASNARVRGPKRSS